MAAPKTIIWKLEPHSRAKHEILRRYLQAWVPILNHGGFAQVLYIDGFAGPGCYSGGEEGSPIIALRTALDHKTSIKSKVLFFFVEKDKARADVLNDIISKISRPHNFHVKVASGERFETAFGDLLKFYNSKSRSLPPTFAFLDPFGWTGVSFSTVKQIMSYPHCEVLITFMYEEINRFISHPDQELNFDLFFGTKDWRDGTGLTDTRQRNGFFHDLYVRQLKFDAGARYVRSFQMRNDADVTDYYLFYATNSLMGLKKMKEAMWKIDESGEFTFSDATDPSQLVLFTKQPNFDALRKQILSRFGGQEITVGDLESFVIAETAYRETHYKRHVLRPMELSQPQLLEVINPSPARKIGTYSDNSLKIRFQGH